MGSRQGSRQGGSRQGGSRPGSRGLLRVRSSGMIKGAPGTESRALENPYEEFDYFYKLIVIGDEMVGKTNFLLRIARGHFEKKPKTTYGVEFAFKTIPLP